MKRISIIVISLVIGASLTYASGVSDEPKVLEPGLYAEIITNRGTMVFELDWKNAPLTVANFGGLVAGVLPNTVKNPGEPYYDGTAIYRVIRDYAVFAGDPDGTGEGGPGYMIPREWNSAVSTGEFGALVMDGIVTESAGSRFFITIQGDTFLDSKYTTFGRLVQGGATLKRLREGNIIQSIRLLQIGEEAENLTVTPAFYEQLYAEARYAEIEALGAEDPALERAILNLGDERMRTATGIYYSVLTEGEGNAPPELGDRVSMHYTGSLVNGTIFDSSRPKNQTFDFALGRDGVIPGWVEMIMGMTVGEVRRVIIPPAMAYDDQGLGPIPPNSWLIFEMELVAVLKE